MARIEPGRVTDGHEGPLVVFLIGMRVNRWWRVRTWWPVFTAMPSMLRELTTEKERGLLGHQMTIGRHGPVLVQYWRGSDELLAYAHDRDGAHRPAWRAYNERARAARGVVGIWHETYEVAAGAHETIYVGMPAVGLAAATTTVPVARRGEGAGARLGKDTGGQR